MKIITLSDDLLRSAGIPEPYWALGIDTFPGSQRIIKQAHTFANGNVMGAKLVIAGSPVSGKTFLLTYILRVLLSRDFTVEYATLEDLIEHCFNPKERDESFYRRVCSPRFLGIDNVDFTSDNSAPLTVLDKIVKMRKDLDKPILITSVYDRGEFDTAARETSARYFSTATFIETQTFDPVTLEMAQKGHAD